MISKYAIGIFSLVLIIPNTALTAHKGAACLQAMIKPLLHHSTQAVVCSLTGRPCVPCLFRPLDRSNNHFLSRQQPQTLPEKKESSADATTKKEEPSISRCCPDPSDSYSS